MKLDAFKASNSERHVDGARYLLNLPGHHSTAAIVAEVVYELDGKWSSCDAQIVLSDCSRVLSLEFCPTDLGEHENDLHKIDTLISTLQEFRRALKRAHRHAHRAYERKDEEL